MFRRGTTEGGTQFGCSCGWRHPCIAQTGAIGNGALCHRTEKIGVVHSAEP